MTAHLAGPWDLHHQPESEDFQWSLQNDDRAFVLFAFHPDVTDEAEKAIAAVMGGAAEMMEALVKLSNEVIGSLPLMEPLARREMGNTNYAILMQRAQEARALVAKIEASR